MKASVITRFVKTVSVFQESFKSARERSNKKNVHALRISIKRIHALLRFAEIISPEAVNAKKAYKKLKPVFKKAGELRTLHIYIALLSETKEKTDSIVREIRKLKKKTCKQREILQQELRDFNIKKQATELRAVLQHSFVADKKKLLKETLAFAATKFRRAHQLANENDFHGARKELKQAHYILELFPSGKKSSAQLAAIDPIEKKAGRWHDIHSLLRLLDKERQKKTIRFPEKSLQQELKTLEEQIPADFKKAKSIFTGKNY